MRAVERIQEAQEAIEKVINEQADAMLKAGITLVAVNVGLTSHTYTREDKEGNVVRGVDFILAGALVTARDQNSGVKILAGATHG